MISSSKRRRLGWLTVALFAMSALLMPATAVFAAPPADLHCPDKDHPSKVQSVVDGDLDGIVLEKGTLFCVKGGTADPVSDTADGETTLAEYLGSGQNVSYYIVYGTVQETTTETTTEETTTEETTTEETTTEETTTEETTTTTDETTTTTGSVSGTTSTTTTDETMTTTGSVSGTTSEQTTTAATGNVSGTTSSATGNVSGTTTLPETSMVDPVSPVNSGMISLAFLLLGVGSLLFLVLTPAKSRSRD